MILYFTRFKPETATGRWRWLVNGDRSYWSDISVPDDANGTLKFLRVYITTRRSPYKRGNK